MEETWELAALDMTSRSIPAAIKRAIQEEAGYRCAVPTCRDKGPFDFEHIEEWAKVKKHEEHNIILLCAGCHARVTRKEISKSAIKTYKRNLAITNGRFSLFELRVLEKYWEAGYFIEDGQTRFKEFDVVIVSETEKINLRGLLKDRLIKLTPIAYSDSEKNNLEALLSEPEKIPEMTSLMKTMSKQLITDEEQKTILMKFIRQRRGTPQYSAWPTELGIQFIDDYYSGNKID